MAEFSNYVENRTPIANADVDGTELIPVSKGGAPRRMTARQIAENVSPYTGAFPSANAAGTDTYTATLSPAITAYTSGQKVQLVFANPNTGAATINLNGLGARAITKNGATALAAGDISAGQALFLYYDGTQFQIQGGGSGTVADASTTVKGIVELATTAETTTGTDTVRAVTPAGVKAAIDALINAAPGALDTLDELANALGDDANFASTITTALAGKEPTLAAASETVQGKIELATQAETNTGTDDVRVVTPLKLANYTGITNKQLLVNSATALVDGASMDLTAIKHTLTTSSSTRTFTISYTGDDITLIVTLNAATSVFTFPATTLCVSEGSPSGDNTCSLSGISGDKYVIAIKKVGSNYYVVCKNFGQ